MKMYILFGDWSDDGHGRYEKVLVDAPSLEHVKAAQDKILEKYGKKFFEHYAQEYEEPHLTELNWQALIDTNYPIDRFIEYEDYNDWTGMTSLEEVLAADPNPYVGIEFIIDSFIWLHNAFGADIKRLDDKEDIPMLCNWSCQGFKTVGYGCFYG